jgi:hypothetical protein
MCLLFLFKSDITKIVHCFYFCCNERFLLVFETILIDAKPRTSYLCSRDLRFHAYGFKLVIG